MTFNDLLALTLLGFAVVAVIVADRIRKRRDDRDYAAQERRRELEAQARLRDKALVTKILGEAESDGEGMTILAIVTSARTNHHRYFSSPEVSSLTEELVGDYVAERRNEKVYSHHGRVEQLAYYRLFKIRGPNVQDSPPKDNG